MSYATHLACLRCGSRYEDEKTSGGCSKCRTDKFLSAVTVSYDYDKIANTCNREGFGKKGIGLWRYSELLPVKDEKHKVTLSEGGTPLVKCYRLGQTLGLTNLFVKDESRNPTWSFKDRNCCCAISKGLEFGAKVAVIASSGNHGASTAAYAAKAGMETVVFTKGTTSDTFTTQIQAYGGMVVPVSTSEGRWVLMEQCVKKLGWYPVGSYTAPMPTGQPYGIEGCKTLGYEIVQDLGWQVPDRVIIPLGLGEGFYGTWKGLWELKRLGLTDKTPSMVSVETEGGAPLAHALKKGLDYVEKVPRAPTLASSIATNITSYQALRAVKDSDGVATTVTDEEILAAQRLLASEEGLYAEPASAAAVAGLKKLREEKRIDKDEYVVAVMTSAGVKDPASTMKVLPKLDVVEAEWDVFRGFMGKTYGMAL